MKWLKYFIIEFLLVEHTMNYKAPILYNKNNKQFYISLNKKQIPLLKKTHPKFIDIENYKFEYEKE